VENLKLQQAKIKKCKLSGQANYRCPSLTHCDDAVLYKSVMFDPFAVNDVDNELRSDQIAAPGTHTHSMLTNSSNLRTEVTYLTKRDQVGTLLAPLRSG